MSTIADWQAMMSSEKARARYAKLRPLIVAAANKTGVDPDLMIATAFKESRFNDKAWNPKDAAHRNGTLGGMFQFSRATGAEYGLNPNNVHDLPTQFTAAGKFIANNLKRAHGDIRKEGKLYNGAYSYGDDLAQLYSHIKGKPAPTAPVPHDGMYHGPTPAATQPTGVQAFGGLPQGVDPEILAGLQSQQGIDQQQFTPTKYGAIADMGTILAQPVKTALPPGVGETVLPNVPNFYNGMGGLDWRKYMGLYR